MVNDVERHPVAVFRLYAAAVEIFHDSRHFLSVGIAGKRFQNIRSGFLVDFKALFFRQAGIP